MFSREPRIREAMLHPDGTMRVTVELFGRERLLSFTVPRNELVEPPAARRAIDLDDGAEDARARFIIGTYAALVDARFRRGEVPDDVDELADATLEACRFTVCTFGMERRRW